MAQDPIDDVITLGGQKFPVKGGLQGNAASEWETGIKIGPPANDHREHAFFLGLNDFSGGFGTRQVDVREELGNYWYPEDNSPETAFAGRITLPIKQDLVTITDKPVYAYLTEVGNPWVNEQSGLNLFILGSAVYEMLGVADAQPIRRYNTPPGSEIAISSIVKVQTNTWLKRSRYYGGSEYTYDNTTPETRYYVAWAGGGTNAWFSTDIVNWNQTDGQVAHEPGPNDVTDLSVNVIYKVYKENKGTSFVPAATGGGGGTGIWPSTSGAVRVNMFATFNGGYRPLNLYRGSEDSGSSSDAIRVFFNNLGKETSRTELFAQVGAHLLVYDLLFWDKKLLGLNNYGGVGFSVPSSSFNIREAINWSFDYDGYYIDTSYTDNNGDVIESHIEDDPIHLNGTIAEIPGVAGDEPWNTGVFEDGEFVGMIDQGYVGRFIGVAEGPTGEPMPYLRAGPKMFVLDFYARRMIPIDVGAEGRLVSGIIHQGEVMTTDGWNVFAYSPKGNVRNIGMPKKFGIPPNMVGSASSTKTIVNIFSGDTYLFAVVVDTSDNLHPTTTLYRRNGTGWHQVGKVMEDFQGYYGFVVENPGGTVSRAIVLPGTIGAVKEITDTNPDVGYYYFILPNLTHQATIGLDLFGDSGAAFVTGWYDGGFLDINGTLLRLNIDAWSLTATETIKVEYRLNNDEDAAWTQLVDIDGNAAVFDNTHTALYFPGSGSPKAGIEYRTVQFRITLTRGADETRSPELRALILTYLKTPSLRTSWTLPLDINRMIERSQGDDNTFYVDGVAATTESIWAKLKELWNTQTLLEMTIPNVQESFYVKITDMPLQVDDFRDAVDGQGVVTIQVIEPVGYG